MSPAGPQIAIVGTLDTKGAEHRFVAELIEGLGGRPLLVDCGIRGEAVGVVPDVTRDQVAQAAGSTIEKVRALPSRGEAVEAMASGLGELMRRRHAAGEVDGVLSLGGAEGTVLGTAAMQALPVGVPKVMVSAIACGGRTFGPFVGTRDVMIMHSVVDVAGFNRISSEIYTNAATAVVAMAAERARSTRSLGTRRRPVGVSMLGNTQAAVDLLRPLLEKREMELVPFHANGVGGPAMEQMAADGDLTAVIELAVNELDNELIGGVTAPIEPGRFTVAGSHGIPQIVVPACADFFTFGSVAELPAEFADRVLYRHNPQFTLVRANADEMARFGAEMGKRLNCSTGPLVIVWPERGLSLADVEGGEFWDPAADEAFIDALGHALEVDHQLIRVGGDVNSDQVAEAIAAATLEAVSLAPLGNSN